MRIPKRSVRAQIGLPPFRLTGMVHVPTGSRPADGVLNASDRFLTMTEATIASADIRSSPNGRGHRRSSARGHS